MRKVNQYSIWVISLLLLSCGSPKKEKEATSSMPIYKDVPYKQDFAIKFNTLNDDASFSRVFMDRNKVIQVASSEGILRTHAGQFLYPGSLVEDKTYRPLADKQVKNFTVHKDQFVYLNDKAVFSNAWAGSLYVEHKLPNAFTLAAGNDLEFLISDGSTLQFLSKTKAPWTGKLSNDRVQDILFDEASKSFWVLGKKSIAIFDTETSELRTLYQDNNLTAFAFYKNKMIVGTNAGYLTIDPTTGKQIGTIQTKLPFDEITALTTIDDQLWFGSTKGAFKLRAIRLWS